MKLYLDSSVLVAALVEDEPSHEGCLELLRRKDLTVWTHALAETFATLTGGRLGIRVPPAIAAQLIEESLLPRLQLVELSAADVKAAIGTSASAGVRGGAIFDYLHLVAARKSTAETLYTLNVRHFAALSRSGDPRIETLY
jgi:predicted nucleic acid-binding protein